MVRKPLGSWGKRRMRTRGEFIWGRINLPLLVIIWRNIFFRMRRPVYRPPPLSRGGGGGGSRRPSRRRGGGGWRQRQRYYSSEWPAAAEAVKSTSKGKGKGKGAAVKKGGKKTAKGRSASRGGKGPTKMISRWEQIRDFFRVFQISSKKCFFLDNLPVFLCIQV